MTTTEHDHIFYRFEALLLAIELFTQRFDTEQLSLFSFDFVNEVLTLNASAMFLREGNQFVLKQKRLYADIGEYHIADTNELRQLATFRGHIITRDFEQILQAHDIERLHIQWVMPLIIDDTLHGFIISNGNQSGEFTDADIIMSSTVMRLINNSLENSKHLSDLQVSNAKLDQKNFNLFAINQSTKVLLSEMSLDRLHETATDVFSEVTTSQVTAFGIIDPLTLRLKITGFRNVMAYTRYYGEFELRHTEYNGPIVLHVERDRRRLEELFVNYDQLFELEAEYVILIVKKHIIGMVTLSKPVNDEREYDDSIFELVESLANSAFIAISNAVSFEEANRQRTNAQNKLRLLQTLNRLVKNVNECATPDELCYFTLKTMGLAFPLKKALICLKQDGTYVVTDASGFHDPACQASSPISSPAGAIVGRALMRTEDIGEALMENGLICDYTSEGAARYLPRGMLEWIGSTNCCVIAPLTIANKVVLNDNPYPLGFLIVLETENNLLEEEALLIETIASNISPVLHQMEVAQTLRKQFVRDERRAFMDALSQKITICKPYELPFYVYYKRYSGPPFRDQSPAEAARTALEAASSLGFDSEELELFAFDGYLFAIADLPLEADDWREIPHAYQLEAVVSYPYE